MERNILERLVNWKGRKDRKPLLLEGARQTGKTWIAKEFGARYYSDIAYVNFDKEKLLKNIFSGTLSPDILISSISAALGQSIDPDNTLIIFDEVQEEPRALASLKYFCEDAPQYNIIATGSFMGIALHQGTSFPVGKVQLEKLYPLSFTEFLEAMGRKQMVELLDTANIEAICSLKELFKDYLKMYYAVGGMPEAVKSFASDADYNKVRDIQNEIIELYRHDFSKHAPTSMIPRLNQVWDSIPAQLSKDNRKFMYGQITKGSRAKDFEAAITWLSDCGLIHLVHRVNKPGLPLKSYAELSAFKIYLNDVGLLGALGELEIKTIIGGSRIFEEFKGAMTEQYVLQQLISELKVTPYYYSAENSRGEIDFLIQKDGRILPIEVKSAENLQAKSLKVFTEKYDLHGARISMSDYREQDWLTNYPLYAFAKLL